MENLSVYKGTRFTTEVKDCASDISVLSNTFSRKILPSPRPQIRLIILIRTTSRHLRRERPRSNAINPNAQRDERMRPLLRKMQQRRLSRGIGELPSRRRFSDTGYAGDIDDGAREAWCTLPPLVEKG